MSNFNLPPNARIDPNTGLVLVTNDQGFTFRVNPKDQTQLDQYVNAIASNTTVAVQNTDADGNPKTSSFDPQAIQSRVRGINAQNALMTQTKRETGLLGNEDGTYTNMRTGETLTQAQAAAVIREAGLPPAALTAITPKSSPTYEAAQTSVNNVINEPSNLANANAQQPAQAPAGPGTGPEVAQSLGLNATAPAVVPATATTPTAVVSSPVSSPTVPPIVTPAQSTDPDLQPNVPVVGPATRSAAAAPEPAAAPVVPANVAVNQPGALPADAFVSPPIVRTVVAGEPVPISAVPPTNEIPPVPVVRNIEVAIPPDSAQTVVAGAPATSAVQASSAKAPAANYLEIYNPETGQYDVVDLGSGQVVGTNLSKQDAASLASTLNKTGETPEQLAGPSLGPLKTAPPPVADTQASAPSGPPSTGSTGTNPAASRTAGLTNDARNASTQQTRANQPAAADWRVRLSLAKNSDYLYNLNEKERGILAPLWPTNGVIFPYTPAIESTYRAKYNAYDLVHSNYRGYFYQNSSVEEISIKGTFTAQDTREAQYLLAVIHFFRSVTKMFYGQDNQSGTPPPIVYLSGLGQYQYNNHPCLVSSFNYNLPTDVDYVRANGFNNIGLNMENRRNRTSGPAPGGSFGAVVAIYNRLTNSGLQNKSLTNRPSPSQVNQNVANQNSINSTYVPSKMDISISLLPIQTRNQVSKQFSLKGFANGDLLKGGSGNGCNLY